MVVTMPVIMMAPGHHEKEYHAGDNGYFGGSLGNFQDNFSGVAEELPKTVYSSPDGFANPVYSSSDGFANPVHSTSDRFANPVYSSFDGPAKTVYSPAEESHKTVCSPAKRVGNSVESVA